MKFDWLLRDSVQLTVIFCVLAVIAVFTQLTKETITRSLPYPVRGFVKAAPALLLTVISYYVGEPLTALMFLFCTFGDILLDLPQDKYPLGFPSGGISFAIALLFVCILSYQHPLPAHPLVPLAITNIVIAIFVLRWVLASLHGVERVLEVIYFGLLIIANVFASTSYVPVFLGSSLWFMSDLSIGLGAKVSDDPVNSLDTLSLYHLGLYFLAIGFLGGVII